MENSAVSTGLEMSVFISIPKKGNAKECSNHETIALISHASKVKLKILQVRLQQYMNQEIPDVQAGFRKDRGIRDQIVNMHWTIENTREFQKTTSASLITLKPLTVWVTKNWKNSKRVRYTRPLYMPPEKPTCWSRTLLFNLYAEHFTQKNQAV